MISPRIILTLITIIAVTACNQVGPSNQNIQASQTTNEVALSNLNLGIAYIREGDFEKALDKLDRANQADPGYAPTHNVYGLLYQQLGQSDKAENSFKRAIRLNSNDSRTLNNYGRFLCQQNRINDAEKTFLKAASNPLYENPEIAITNAGLCLENDGQKDKAEEYYRQALERNSRMPQALLKMCEINFNNDDYLSARGYLQRYQEVARHTPRSLWLGIQVEQKLGGEDLVSSYALLLKNSFPDSNEASLLRESGIQ